MFGFLMVNSCWVVQCFGFQLASKKVIHSGAIFKTLLKIMTNNAQMSHKLDHCVQISNGVWRDKAIQNTKCFRWIHRYWGVWISDHHCTKSWKKLKGNNFRIFRFYGRLFTTHVLYPLLIVLHFVIIWLF